jgi:hypothetical protein
MHVILRAAFWTSVFAGPVHTANESEKGEFRDLIFS